MPSTRYHPASFCKQGQNAVICFFAAVVAFSGIVGDAGSAIAQNVPAGLLAPGNAAVTGFSGAIPPAQIPPGVDPRETTFIDLDGPSARIVGLQNMAGPPNGQLVPAPKPFTVTAAQVGQVFAVVLDNSTPPNVYVAASSAYGLPIVAPGAGGQPRHVRTGAPNASFMPGLWGGAAPNGGPGSIWKIDGVTGSVSLFANVTLGGASNSGPALGGLAFDPDSNSLFAADRDTGMIHRFAMTGAERSRYDHGVPGRTAQGLPPVPFDSKKRLAITNPKFDSEQPATWSYAPPERLIFGLGVFRGRLYYAVAADLQIWSVGLSPDGSFASDATREINVPPAAGPTEISKIIFDDRGRMFLAERPAPTGAYDFQALTPEGIGRALRYAIVDSYPGAPRIWQQVPDEYAVGVPPQHRNGNGGVAIGLDYDAAGMLDRASCGGLLWSTGERLRKSADPGLAARLRQSGPENVDGLQGNLTELVRPQNVPPLKTWFIDYDDRVDDGAARGHMGDIAIWRVCGPLLHGGWRLPSLPPGGGSLWFPPPPSKSCPPGQMQPGLQCCPTGSSPDPSGQCKPWCPNGAMDPGSQELCGYGFDNTKFDPNNLANSKCIDGTAPDPALGTAGCAHASPLFKASVCPAGWSKQNKPNVGLVCAPTAKQLSCGQGEQVSPIDNQCHALCPGGGMAWPAAQCCPPGAVVSVTGQCCPPGSKPDPKSGQCGPPTFSCPPGQLSKIDNTCCPSGQVPNNVIGGCCPPGQIPDPVTGICKQTACAVPPNALVNGKCCSPDDLKQGGACWNCGPGKTPVGPNNFCCDDSKVYTDASGAKACCLSGVLKDGKCTGGTPMQPNCSPSSTDPNCCAGGYKPAGNTCCLESQLTTTGVCCPAGQKPSGPNKDQCQPLPTGWIPGWPDGDGTHDGWKVPKIPKIPDGACIGPGCFTLKICCASGLIPTADNKSCCAPHLMTVFGTCCSAGNPPNPKTGLCTTTVKSLQKCSPGYTLIPDGSCCLNRFVSPDGKTCGPGQGGLPVIPVPSIAGCGLNMHKDPRSGLCVADKSPAQCRSPNRMVGGRCCSPREIAAGQCGPKLQQPTCGPNQVLRGNICVDIIRRPIPPPVIRRPIPPPLIRRPPPEVRRPIPPPVIRRFERQ
ncbi:hypothetical protein [Bradyrhizobium sp.]|uniref:hypothetical protein n=1 Tax=Bradyrhizobium sp. TaxID=376 RepID=UPI0025BF0422|nr:hypothetical protein [Bradyrhizobium sp.]